MNFNRSTKQIFTGDSSSIANGRVNLGVTSKNVQYVANKTGETSSVDHDMAIVFGKKTDYVICVFSRTGSEEYAIPRIRDISGTVYKYLNK